MRQRVLTISMAAALVIIGGAAAAAQRVDFSGAWALDKSKSEGLPPGMDQAMTVKQAGDRVDVETKVSGTRGEQQVKDNFILDGKETEFTPPLIVAGQSPKGKRTSRWSADGKGFDVTEEATFEGDEGPETVKATRHWQLSDDGKTLTVEMTFEGAQGARKTRRVFVRK